MLIHSPHVLRVVKPYKTPHRHYLITELCNGGDLAKLIRLRGSLTEPEAKIMISQIVIGMKDIALANIIHRDLKLANILLHFPDQPELISMPKD